MAILSDGGRPPGLSLATTSLTKSADVAVAQASTPMADHLARAFGFVLAIVTIVAMFDKGDYAAAAIALVVGDSISEGGCR